MYSYRYPTDIFWNDDGEGYRHIQATSAEDALTKCPRSDIGMSNIQVKTAQGFQWVQNVPRHLGGIDMGRHTSH